MAIRTLLVGGLALALFVGAAAAAWADPGPIFVNPDAAIIGKGLPSDPVGAVEQARQQIAAGNLDAAIAGLERYVAGHPNEVVPMRFLGDLYFRRGEVDRAKIVYETILRTDWGDKETHNRLGTVYAMQGRVDDAIRQFELSLPGTDSIGDLVELHWQRGDLPVYVAEMQSKAAENSNDPEVQAELGKVYEAIHRTKDAVVAYERALDLDHKNLTAINGLGLAYLDLGDYGKATARFNDCLKIDPARYSCLANMGGTLALAGDLDGAQKALTRAHAIAPERFEAIVNLGFVDDARGNWKSAVGRYAIALEIWPYATDAYVDLASDYEAHQLVPLAETVLLKGLAVSPDDGRIHILLGRAYVAQGKPELAGAQFQAAEHSLDPGIASLASQAADALQPKP